jgi:Uncharacterized conserved protein (COG2071)
MAKAIGQTKGGLAVGHAGLGEHGAGFGSTAPSVHDGDTITVRAIGNVPVREHSDIVVKRKAPTFPFLRSVGAHMVERYIFNYRIKPAELKKRLPAPWLEPDAINGYSVVSFCILWLEKLTLTPMPSLFGFSTISCAYRIGVLDVSEQAPVHSVYVVDRRADLPLCALLGPIVLQDTIPVIKASIAHDNDKGTRVQMSYTDGSALFEAAVRPLQGSFQSQVFDSIDAFAAFIRNGVSSYAPSLHPGKLTKVDLHKEEVAYEPLEATIDFSELNEESWSDAGMEFDCAVRARTGAGYEWIYRGLWSE